MILHADVIKELDERILDVLARMHEEFPLMTSHDRQKVQAQLAYVDNDALIHAAVERLIHAANRNGGVDNITAILARVEAN